MKSMLFHKVRANQGAISPPYVISRFLIIYYYYTLTNNWHLQGYVLEFHNFNFVLSIIFFKMYQCWGWTVWKVTIDCYKSDIT